MASACRRPAAGIHMQRCEETGWGCVGRARSSGRTVCAVAHFGGGASRPRGPRRPCGTILGTAHGFSGAVLGASRRVLAALSLQRYSLQFLWGALSHVSHSKSRIGRLIRAAVVLETILNRLQSASRQLSWCAVCHLNRSERTAQSLFGVVLVRDATPKRRPGGRHAMWTHAAVVKRKVVFCSQKIRNTR